MSASVTLPAHSLPAWPLLLAAPSAPQWEDSPTHKQAPARPQGLPAALRLLCTSDISPPVHVSLALGLVCKHPCFPLHHSLIKFHETQFRSEHSGLQTPSAHVHTRPSATNIAPDLPTLSKVTVGSHWAPWPPPHPAPRAPGLLPPAPTSDT